MPDVLGIGTLYVLVIVLAVVGLIVLAIYAAWSLRKDENWEQR